MVPPPTRAPAHGRPSMTFPAGSKPSRTCASFDVDTPTDAASDASQRSRSNSGYAVMAVLVSITPRPHRAWLATAWAGQ